MTRDDIVRMAREAMQSDPEMMGGTYFTLEVSDLERFSSLVLKHTEYDGIHTCHAECQRPACVAGREARKARLIAAAPDLLEALTKLLDMHERCERGFAPHVELRFAIRDMARAAIAKARGEK
jgi:hypothetical protein